MTNSTLFELSSPPLWVTERTRAGLDSLYFALCYEGSPSVNRIIRGRKSRSSAAFFDEAAAALQFPEYFGENWSAFEDCFRDLNGIYPLPHLIFVNQASQLLAEEDEMLQVFLDIVNETCKQWLTPDVRRNRGSIPLKLILQEDAANMPILLARLAATGVSSAVL